MTCHYDECALQEYHDGVLGEAESSALRLHLRGCPQCTALDRRVIAFDRAMRMIPLDRPDPSFTEQTLARIARPGPAEWLDRLLEPRFIAAATIGLFGLAGTVSAVLVTMPVPSGTATGFRWNGARNGVWEGMVAAPEVLAGWATRLIPQVFSQDTLHISLAVVLLVPLFLCVDRILARRQVTG